MPNPAIDVDRLLTWGLFALVFLAILPFGAVEPWAVSTIQTALFLLFAAAILWSLARGRATRLHLWPAALLIVLLHLLQLIPWPAWLVERLSPTSHALSRILLPQTGTSPGETISVSPPDTFSALLWFCGCLAAFWLAGMVSGRDTRDAPGALFGIPVRTRGERTALALCFTLGLAGTIQALYGLADYAMGWDRIFFYVRKYPMAGVAGTFINTNHCAALLALCLPLLLSLLLLLRRAESKGPKPVRQDKASRGPARTPHRALIAATAAAALLVLLALVFTRSGGGMASAAAGLGFFSVVYLHHGGWRRAVNPALVVLVAATISLVVIFLVVPHDFEVGTVVAETGSDVENRATILGQSLTIVRDFPLLGSGAGTYTVMMLHYFDRMVVHAHNDYLELLCDLGPLALLCAAAVIIFTLRPALPFLFRRRSRRSPSRRFPSRLILPLGLAASLLGLAVNAALDFPFRIPAIALAASVLLGLFIGLIDEGESPADR